MRLLSILFLIQGLAFAQDERFFRKIFTDELQGKGKKPVYKVEVSTPAYIIDINRDGVSEKLVVAKKDGLDFFQIKDRFDRVVFERKLDAKGIDSNLYKVHLKTLSAGIDALILHFDEGNSGNVVFQSTARVYMVTIEDRSLEKIYFGKGPAFYYEKEKLDFLYARRFYTVDVIDYNGDGVKEVSATYNGTQRIYFYKGKGRWSSI